MMMNKEAMKHMLIIFVVLIVIVMNLAVIHDAYFMKPIGWYMMVWLIDLGLACWYLFCLIMFFYYLIRYYLMKGEKK